MAQIARFSNKATDYAKYRPDYPKAVIEKILAGLGDPTQLIAVDVGAGTGIASRQLAEYGVQVKAIEPVATMVNAATPHPFVEFQVAPAESIPLPDSIANLVTSFQAFHWFKFDRSLQEFQRILQPSGRLALIWYKFDTSDPFTRRYVRLIDQTKEKHSPPIRPTTRLLKTLRKLKPTRIQLLRWFCWIPHFTNVRRYHFANWKVADINTLIGFARSQSTFPNDGPVWDELIPQLENLAKSSGGHPRIKFKITMFIGKSKKDISQSLPVD